MGQNVVNIYVKILHGIVLKWDVLLMKIQNVLIVAVALLIKTQHLVHMMLIIIYVCGKEIHVQ